MFASFRVAAFAATSCLAIAGTALAQGCNFGDDGLANAACCAPAQTALPQFPGFQVSGQYACLKDCQLENQFSVRVSTNHFPVLCDYAVVALSVLPGSATSPGFSGALLAKYARTWMEPTTPAPRQVWRFLVNGDLTPTAGAPPCPLPPHPAGSTINFHGHLDYACEINAAGLRVFRMALSLNHLPGCIEHGFFSGSPLAPPFAHDDRSYHLVAPGNFTFTAVPAPFGPVLAEDVRSTQFLPGYSCLGEGRFTQGVIQLRTRDCLCNPTATGTFPWVHYDLNGGVACVGLVSPFAGLPIGPPLPPLPTGCTALGLGAWTGSAASFPGGRTLAVHWGLMRYQDPCNPNDPPFHFVQGVSTSGVPGTVFTNPGAAFNTFLDLQNMLSPNSLSGGAWTPAWGSLFVSKVIWNLNLL